MTEDRFMMQNFSLITTCIFFFYFFLEQLRTYNLLSDNSESIHFLGNLFSLEFFQVSLLRSVQSRTNTNVHTWMCVLVQSITLAMLFSSFSRADLDTRRSPVPCCITLDIHIRS